MYRSGAQTPLLRVSRPVSACSRCRGAKIKCDGKLPACTACEKSGRSGHCSSANDQFAKGKERSYVASLESRIEKLERRLAYARSRKASVAMHDADETPKEAPDRKDSLATIRAAIHGKAARKREVAEVNELVSDFGFLSVDATTRDFESSTTKMTFARLVLAATNHDPISQPTSFQLPHRSVSRSLCQFYLDNIFRLFPVFSETALFNAHDAIYQVNGRTVTDFEYWLLYMVLAIASTGQSRSNMDSYYMEGLTWVGRALPFADRVFVPGYVSQIQALVLLVQYAMLDPAHFDSWHLIGFACRAVVDIGFHQDPPYQQQPEKKLLDLRRRIFYCVYSLDRSVSIVHARAFSFSDDSTTVDFPAVMPSISSGGSETYLNGPHSTEAAVCLLRLRRLQSNWYQKLFQSSREPLQHSSKYIFQMCQDMQEWFDSLPQTLPSAFRDLFEIELFYSYVYCLAPSCRAQSVSTFEKTLIFEYCIAYMHKIFAISQDTINVAFYTYHDALRVFFIGSQFIEAFSESQDQLLNGMLSYSPVTASSPAPPPLPAAAGLNNYDRSINCITQIRETLKTFGQRWENSKTLLSNFEMQSEPILMALHQRRSPIIEKAQNSPSYGTQASYNQFKTPLKDEWSNVNATLIDPGSLIKNEQGRSQVKIEPGAPTQEY